MSIGSIAISILDSSILLLYLLRYRVILRSRWCRVLIMHSRKMSRVRIMMNKKNTSILSGAYYYDYPKGPMLLWLGLIQRSWTISIPIYAVMIKMLCIGPIDLIRFIGKNHSYLGPIVHLSSSMEWCSAKPLCDRPFHWVFPFDGKGYDLRWWNSRHILIEFAK